MYFFDEPFLHKDLAQTTASYKACREAGGKVFCWFRREHIDDAIRRQIDIGITSGWTELDEIEKFHKLGHKILWPVAMPVIEKSLQSFRRGGGLTWWRHKCDGIHPYCYQHGRGHIWNDFDHEKHRDYAFTYPTVDGVIDTLCWEALREGIDDVRYVTTLEEEIKKTSARKKDVADRARQWLNDLSVATCDLDETRAKVAEWILKLQ